MIRADSPALAAPASTARDVPARRLLLGALAVFLAATAAYLPKVGNNFTFDDPVFITKNPHLASPDELLREFTRSQQGLYRPLRSALLGGMLAAFGADRRPPFHLAGIFLHAACSTLTLFVVWLTLADLPAAVVAGLIFALHPVHADRVANITGSFDLFGLALGYLGWVLLLAYDRGRRRLLAWSGALALLLGCLASEEAVMVAPLLACCHAVTRGDRKRRALALALAAAVVVAYVAIRAQPVHGVARTDAYAAGTFQATFWTMAVVFWRYVGLLFFPVGLTPAYGPVIYAAPGVAPLAGLAAIICLLTLGLVVRRRAPAAALGIAWLCLGLAPFSNLLPSDTLMAERYLYAGLGGFAAAAGAGLASLFRRRRGAIALAAALLALYGAGVAARCVAWGHPLALWGQAATREPRSFLANLNAGYHAAEAGRAAAAERFARRAQLLDPTRPEPWLQLGDLAVRRGDASGGLACFRQALAAAPGDCAAYAAAAAAHVLVRDAPQAAAMAQAALRCDPENAQAHYVLAYLLSAAGDCAAAAPHWSAVLRQSPHSPHYGAALALQQRCAEAP